jgi:hypothetical protein
MMSTGDSHATTTVITTQWFDSVTASVNRIALRSGIPHKNHGMTCLRPGLSPGPMDLSLVTQSRRLLDHAVVARGKSLPATRLRTQLHGAECERVQTGVRHAY